MEPEVHIIEKYLQHVKKWLTMTNIGLQKKKEIDLLAINPKTGEKHHIESRVSISSFGKLRLHETKRSNGTSFRNGLDYFSREKFDNPVMVNGVREIFGDTNYGKILVVWDVEEESVIAVAKEKFGIEIWYMEEIIDEINEAIALGKIKGSRDDVLRTVELLLKMHKVSGRKSIRRKIETYDRRYATSLEVAVGHPARLFLSVEEVLNGFCYMFSHFAAKLQSILAD